MFPLYFIIFNINAEPHSFEYINFLFEHLSNFT